MSVKTSTLLLILLPLSAFIALIPLLQTHNKSRATVTNVSIVVMESRSHIPHLTSQSGYVISAQSENIPPGVQDNE